MVGISDDSRRNRRLRVKFGLSACPIATLTGSGSWGFFTEKEGQKGHQFRLGVVAHAALRT